MEDRRAGFPTIFVYLSCKLSIFIETCSSLSNFGLFDYYVMHERGSPNKPRTQKNRVKKVSWKFRLFDSPRRPRRPGEISCWLFTKFKLRKKKQQIWCMLTHAFRVHFSKIAPRSLDEKQLSLQKKITLWGLIGIIWVENLPCWFLWLK